MQSGGGFAGGVGNAPLSEGKEVPSDAATEKSSGADLNG